ncbi:MAG: phosphate regulon sensor histidine kinase PhoR, partial [Gammaproteobacteria bacterium]|nr:phosphate regulon sensor histidine kinase PhoR [Gammaproteobacteria bacterium]
MVLFYFAVALLVMLLAVVWHPGWAVACGLAAILARKSNNLKKLVQWLESDASVAQIPETGLDWERIYNHIVRLDRRHQRAQSDLKRTIKRMHKSASALREGVVMVDGKGNFDWWNSAARKFLGLQKKDQGTALLNLLREPRFFRYFNQGDFSEAITVHSPANYNQILLIEVTVLGQGDKLLIVRDVTDSHEMETMRRDFVGNVSHELRTPLTVIQGYLETLQIHYPDMDGGVQKAHRRMLKHTQRMTSLVQDLLLLTRLETDFNNQNGQVVDMAALCKGARADARAFAQQLDKQLIINLDLDSGVAILGDESELRSLVTNLVFNAVRYTAGGGQIDIYWQATDTGPMLRVTDNGIGIPEEHLLRLTERFYRVDPSRSTESGGTGLGLAIVK